MLSQREPSHIDRSEDQGESAEFLTRLEPEAQLDTGIIGPGLRVTGSDAGPGSARLQQILLSSLRAFEAWLTESGWYGRENECVNAFAHGFLSEHIHPDGPLRTTTQIGIEVSIPQIPGVARKAAVRKDLVIWPSAWGTTFDDGRVASRLPLAVIEWKARQSGIHQPDVDWLRQFTALHGDVLGLVVSVQLPPFDSKLNVVRITTGHADPDWYWRT